MLAPRSQTLLRTLRAGRPFRALARLVRQRSRITRSEEKADGYAGIRFVAHAAGFRVGEVTLLQRPAECGELAGCWLMSLSIRPTFRRMGFGRALCLAVLEAAVGMGARCVRLTVREDNAPAILLYRALGFRLLPSDESLRPELERLARLGGAPYVAMACELPRASEEPVRR